MERGKMYMNGANVFSFAIKTVPKLINDILERYNIEKEQVDLFILHQASFFMLDTIIKKMGIPKDKTFLNLQNYGNSVSSTIPLALYDAEQRGVLKKGMTVLLAGFGIGYSWGCTIIRF
jgi:3-oxoacyl-[acyl-carrier-protein] synthase-3